MSTNVPGDFEELMARGSERSRASFWKIVEFAAANGMTIRTYERDGQILRLLNGAGRTGLPEGFIDMLMEGRQKHGIMKKDESCYTVAFDMVKHGYASGALASASCDGFITCLNHCLNFIVFGDTVIGFDTTANEYIGHDEGGIHALAIVAKDLEELQWYLSQLYGGEWELRYQPSDAEPDPTEILRERLGVLLEGIYG